MSWIDIERQNVKLRVPYQSYLDLFKDQGFEPINVAKAIPAQSTISKTKPHEVADKIEPKGEKENGNNRTGGAGKRQHTK